LLKKKEEGGTGDRFSVSFCIQSTDKKYKNGVIGEQIELLRANHIARITNDFKMDVIMNGYPKP